MFDLVAPRYDRFTRWFSYGMDSGWKRGLIRQAISVLPDGGTVVDLACGTGDLTRAARRHGGTAVRCIGVDPSSKMLELARRRSMAPSSRITYLRGDMMTVPLATGCADVVTIGYGLRNVPDHRAALQEVSRILKSGGWLLTLDFYLPERSIWRRLFLGYLAVAGNAYGWMWHREPAAYGYIAKSIRAFVTPTAFERSLREAGFQTVLAEAKLLGGICIHAARKG